VGGASRNVYGVSCSQCCLPALAIESIEARVGPAVGLGLEKIDEKVELILVVKVIAT
jgi:hypothetical protein